MKGLAIFSNLKKKMQASACLFLRVLTATEKNTLIATEQFPELMLACKH